MDTKTRLDVPVSPTLPPDVNKYVTLSMLKSTETVLSVWQCQEYQSLFGKLMSLGLAETTVTTCAITDSRLVYKSQGVNCRGKRKEWELSVPLSVVSSVLWSNYYQRTNKIFNLFKSLPIPCKSCFLVCCLACPLQDDRKEHFWMGKPGVNVSIVLGRSVSRQPTPHRPPSFPSFRPRCRRTALTRRRCVLLWPRGRAWVRAEQLRCQHAGRDDLVLQRIARRRHRVHQQPHCAAVPERCLAVRAFAGCVKRELRSFSPRAVTTICLPAACHSLHIASIDGANGVSG
jgi:hypothetical protein